MTFSLAISNTKEGMEEIIIKNRERYLEEIATFWCEHDW